MTATNEHISLEKTAKEFTTELVGVSSKSVRMRETPRFIDGHPAHLAIIGSGAFGCALASVALAGGCQVTVFSLEEARRTHFTNDPILSRCHFQVMSSTTANLANFDLIILAISSQSLRTVCRWIVHHQETWLSNETKPLHVVCGCKGIEQDSLKLPSQVMAEELPANALAGTLSGPTFATELRQGLPAAIVIASKSEALRLRTTTLLHRAWFRVYESTDVVGVEVAGALKNVIAIVAGGCDGLELGHNARAAVVTRGFGEIVQIGTKLGADPLTFLGLSGLGDLFLTSTGELSRNRSLGLRLARGESREQIVESTGEVIEGIATTQSAFLLAKKFDIDAPVIRVAHGVIYENLAVSEALFSLVTRQHKGEFDWMYSR